MDYATLKISLSPLIDLLDPTILILLLFDFISQVPFSITSFSLNYSFRDLLKTIVIIVDYHFQATTFQRNLNLLLTIYFTLLLFKELTPYCHSIIYNWHLNSTFYY